MSSRDRKARIKVLSILGTRPEAIKMAPVIKQLQRRPAVIESVVCVTAQHRQMLDQVLALFDLKPDYDLDIMRHDQSALKVSMRALPRLSAVLENEKPSIVLVQGDTTTTFVGALTAFYQKIPVGHIEAGLRSFCKYHPFPEEMNRVLTSHLAEYHFCPTEQARDNLLGMGINANRIFVTGNTVVDALRMVLRRPRSSEASDLGELTFRNRKMIVVTMHRRESFGRPMEEVFEALVHIVRRNSEVEIVFPVHPNPQVRKTVAAVIKGAEKIHLVKPMPYQVFVHLMRRSYLILTDSGGIQEEGAALHKPVLVLRDVTERPEAVQSGTARLIGTARERVVAEVERLLRDEEAYRRMVQSPNPFGEGKASQKIVKAIVDNLRR